MDIDKIETIFLLKNITNQIRMDIVDVLIGSRPSARILTLNGSETENLVKIIVNLNISIKIGRGKKYQNKHFSKLKIIDYFEEDSNTDKQEFNILYLGLSDELASRSREMDEKQNDSLFGEVLGYPKCCIDSIKGRSVPSYRESIFNLSSNQKYNYLTWPVSSIANAPLIPHIPCSINCKGSKLIAEKRIEVIRRLDLDWLNKIYYTGLNSKYSIDEDINEIFINDNTSLHKYNFFPYQEFKI